MKVIHDVWKFSIVCIYNEADHVIFIHRFTTRGYSIGTQRKMAVEESDSDSEGEFDGFTARFYVSICEKIERRFNRSQWG